MTEELTDRLTEEITSLSTKLVTAVSKQLELEEKLFHYHKENHHLKTQAAQFQDINQKFEELTAAHTKLTEDHKSLEHVKQEHESENKKLKAEVEDLTASLFDEANKMVSDASRETYNFKIKNKKLYEELDEKNLIIDNLQTELGELKRLIEGLEVKNTNLTNEKNSLNTNLQETEEAKELNIFNSSIFAPKLKSIRFDLSSFKDFKEFLAVLIDPNFSFDLTTLKLQKWFKKIWIEEFETSINVPATNFLNRWQKGKYFWNLLIEGKVKIEPIKGINETLKLDYNNQQNSAPTPTAIDQPCEFCQEHRNDNLEHSRLHYLKLLDPETLAELISYPLCNYCLIKLRNICEFFAKLRLINKNFYKLSFDNKFDLNNDYKVLKLYLMLVLIRSKIFWSKIGYWDNINEVNSINVDEINLEHFKLLTIDDGNSIHSNEAIKSFEGKRLMEEGKDDGEGFEPVVRGKTGTEEPVKQVEKEKVEKVDKEDQKIETKEQVPAEPEPEPEAKREAEPEAKPEPEAEPVKPTEPAESTKAVEQQPKEQDPEEPETKEPEQTTEPAPSKNKKKNKKKKKNNVKGLINNFEQADQADQQAESDKSAEPTPPSQETNENSSDEEFKDSNELFGLSRKNSKSKQFTQKMNNNLDDTMKMLQEINED